MNGIPDDTRSVRCRFLIEPRFARFWIDCWVANPPIATNFFLGKKLKRGQPDMGFLLVEVIGSMSKILIAAIFAGGMFLGVLVCLRLGWKIGRKRFTEEGKKSQAGLGAIEGSIYGLMGLMVAFTFSGAAIRFDDRRDLLTEEVNAIGTAWMRLDLLDLESRNDLREMFRDYLDSRITLFKGSKKEEDVERQIEKSREIQVRIWERLVAAVDSHPSPPIAQSTLAPVNEMFDIGASRILATRQHPPSAIFLMLGTLVLVSSLMAGFGMGESSNQSPLHIIGFALITALTIYMILDLEYPRLGLIRVDSFDQALIELRVSME